MAEGETGGGTGQGGGQSPPGSLVPAGRHPVVRGETVANEAGLRALGVAIERAAPPRRRRSRRQRLGWTLGITGAVIVLVIGGVAGYGWYLNHEIHRISVKDLTASATSGQNQGTENILLVGSTSRCALKVQNPAYGLCSAGVDGVNSDVVMILHLDPTTRAVSILSIPRDLFVPNARKEGANKIDAALYEGPTQLVDAIQEDFGIPIQHYVTLNFDTFANVVDALGGIKMYFPEPVYDAYSGLNVQTTGCLTLNGTQALQVVRARHLQYKAPGVTSNDPSQWPQETQSDIARIRRDHEFLRVLATSVAKRGLDNPLTDQQIVAAVAPQLTVDSGLSASDMVHLALDFHSVDANTAPQLTLPVSIDQFGSYQYEGGNYGDIEFPDQPQDQSVIDQFLGVTPGTDTMTGTALPSPANVTVAVENGTGVTNQATDTGTALGQLGFHVTSLGDTAAVAAQSETVVSYASATRANLAAAQAVAHSLSGAVIMALDPTAAVTGAEVTVTTGTDFSVNAPAAAGHGATSTSAPVTTTTTAPSATAQFSAPTSANEALAPWDPRACTPSGGEGG